MLALPKRPFSLSLFFVAGTFLSLWNTEVRCEPSPISGAQQPNDKNSEPLPAPPPINSVPTQPYPSAQSYPPAPSYPPARASQPQPIYQDLLSVSERTRIEQPLTTPTVSGWWQPMVTSSIQSESRGIPVSLQNLLWRALTHSSQIKVFSELPLIRATAIGEAHTAFDWSAFLDARWDDLSDPVGSSLTTGGASRYENHDFSFSGGVRKKNRIGGQFEISQQLGYQDTNSKYFTPDPQGTTRLMLRYTQPLMRGRGRAYNESLIVLAQIDKGVADEEFRRQLESHLLEVSRSYWALYLERAIFWQKLNSFRRAEQIVQALESRREIDTSESQLISSHATMAQRKSDLLRSRQSVKNAEARIRALVNDPELGPSSQVELIPTEPPLVTFFPIDLNRSLAQAIQCRPEISQVIQQIKAGSIRQNMAKHELMPILNLVTEAYVSGLEGDSDVGGAWLHQFDTGEPSYSVGLQFEVPLGNRAAKFRLQRRRHELRQLQHQYITTLETIKMEVEVAYREMRTSQQEIASKGSALEARKLQLEALSKRWQQLPGEDVSASLALENLLLAQERLAESENQFVRSQVTYSLSLSNLKRALGILLQEEQVSIHQMHQNGLPTQNLSKPILSQSPPRSQMRPAFVGSAS